MRARTLVVAAATTLAVVAVAGLAAAQPLARQEPAPPAVPEAVAPPEPAPPGTPFRIGYASTAGTGPADGVAEPSDVFSADETGADRRNHTGRPGLRDDAPAYSPDGAALAYSAHDPAGGARIVVADAEGRDGRTLAPAGTLATDLDLDPTWSPDGTMLAFTRQRAGAGTGGSRILVVRVADGELLGEVPMPGHLAGSDAAPAWSPDGTRIALARTASQQVLEPPLVDPPVVDFPVRPIDEYDFPVEITVPEFPADPDIVFLIDATLSMQDAIDDVRDNVETIVDSVRADEPTARFGVAYYRDGDFDEDFFGVLQPLTDDPAELAAALGDLTVAGGGADGPEDWIFPLHWLATGGPDIVDDEPIAFEPDRTPIVVLIGDASAKEPSPAAFIREAGNLRLTDADGNDGNTLEALVEAGIRVVGVDVETNPAFADGLNGDRGSFPDNVPGQATLLRDRTGGAFVAAGQGPGAVSEAIVTGVRGVQVTVEAEVEACEPGLSAQVTPPSQAVGGGEVAEFVVFGAVFGVAPAGAVLRCVIGYQLGDGSRVTQEIVVRVTDGVSPLVRVDDITVPTNDPAGVVVDYQVAAVDAAREPLTPACTPASGSRFPVGQTVVTCTATDSVGNTGSDTAVVSVALGAADGLTRIWVASLTFPGPGTVAVTHQVDLSATLGPECTAGANDTEPAWAPDAASLAFTDAGGSPGLCVLEVVGGSAGAVAGAATRELVGAVDGAAVPSPPPPPGQPGNPAWSPDGLLIAFDVDQQSIWTVAADGADPPEPLITGDGDHRQPAFRRLALPDPAVPALALTATVAPTPGFLGGDDLTVRYTVRNDSTVPLADVVLTAELPDALPATPASGCGSATSCALGVVPAGGTVEVLVRLAPEEAIDDLVAGEVTGATEDGATATATASAPVVVLEPILEISPELGPPGRVARAQGSDFPPGAEVRLVWRDGITATDDTVTVAPDGTFTWPALVFRNDALGLRELHAEPVSGPAFRTATVDFLVVPRTQQPPIFEGRG